MKKLIQQVRTFILSIIMDRILYCIIYKTESALKVFDKHVYCLPHFLLCLSDCLVCRFKTFVRPILLWVNFPGS